MCLTVKENVWRRRLLLLNFSRVNGTRRTTPPRRRSFPKDLRCCTQLRWQHCPLNQNTLDYWKGSRIALGQWFPKWPWWISEIYGGPGEGAIRYGRNVYGNQYGVHRFFSLKKFGISALGKFCKRGHSLIRFVMSICILLIWIKRFVVGIQ